MDLEHLEKDISKVDDLNQEEKSHEDNKSFRQDNNILQGEAYINHHYSSCQEQFNKEETIHEEEKQFKHVHYKAMEVINQKELLKHKQKTTKQELEHGGNDGRITTERQKSFKYKEISHGRKLEEEMINQKSWHNNQQLDNINKREKPIITEEETIYQESEHINRGEKIINQESESNNKEENIRNQTLMNKIITNEENIIHQASENISKDREIIDQDFKCNKDEEIISEGEENVKHEEMIISQESVRVKSEKGCIDEDLEHKKEKKIPKHKEEKNIYPENIVHFENIGKVEKNINQILEGSINEEKSIHQESKHINAQEIISKESEDIYKQETVSKEEETVQKISNQKLEIGNKVVEIIYRKSKHINKGDSYETFQHINKDKEGDVFCEESENMHITDEKSQIITEDKMLITQESKHSNKEEELITQKHKHISRLREITNKEPEHINKEPIVKKEKDIIEIFNERISNEEDVLGNPKNQIISHLLEYTNKMSLRRDVEFSKGMEILNHHSKQINEEEGVIGQESEHIKKVQGVTNNKFEYITKEEELKKKESRNFNKDQHISNHELGHNNNEKKIASKKIINKESYLMNQKEDASNHMHKKIDREGNHGSQEKSINKEGTYFNQEDGKASKVEKNVGNGMEIIHYRWEAKRNKITEKLKELNLVTFQTSKLSHMEVLKIGHKDLKKVVPRRIEDVPYHFLQSLMALDSTARNTRLNQSSDTKASKADAEEIDFLDDMDTSNSIHPLDVLCLLLHCSDNSMQQEIMTKMSICQFALPLLLPAGQDSDFTFMLWAMRNIVKRWRPQFLAGSNGSQEENLVNIPMPVFSFVRLGKCNLSKSKILNEILSPAHQHHNFFVHENMEGANIVRNVSDGLVEISWFFPGGREILDLFPDPIAITNLRGDLEDNWNQFNFLTKVSTAVFLFIESIDGTKYKVLSNIEKSNTNYFIILVPSSRYISMETHNHIKMLYPMLKINRKNVLVKNSSINNAQLVKKLNLMITGLITSSPYYITLEEMSRIAEDLGIHVDENSEEHQKTRQLAVDITSSIRDIVQYKCETMRLQGTYWQELTKTEKEMCRMKGIANHNAEDYRAKLVKKYADLRRQQNECGMPDGIHRFIVALTSLQHVEKHFFLRWMKFYLDSIARSHLSARQLEYRKHSFCMIPNLDKLKKLDHIISNSSLGVEHFIREVGQFYESECFLTNEPKLHELPGAAADLLLDGFPLELIDGDASNIPLQWISDILTKLDAKAGGQCRIRVITVLGVQSTGKSTLLNTMFGLQFPVASGRCTRGAFMTLIKLKDYAVEELECEFILVIDTEGLKAPELASLENTYEHDNELATFVVGLSDITIINMAMENTAEMKDILQIVVHAFLRMKELGKKPNCQFVHQNVSDVSAHDRNMRDRKKLLEQLDEMTHAASRMEERSNVKFSDVMDYDLEENSWYIPSLWHGVPPMASVNTGYSETVFKLKIHLYETMKKQLKSRKSQSISEFIQWIKSLWNAVKYERFIFSFRNSLVAEAYNQLSIKYSELEWNFRKRMHKWITEAENEILNQPVSGLNTDMWICIKEDMYRVLQEQESLMRGGLENYFENESRHAYLLEKYREDFFRSITSLKNEIDDHLTNKCREAIHIQKGKHEIQYAQNSYLRIIEDKATSLLDNCKNKNYQLSNDELEKEFEVMWNKTVSGLQFTVLQKHNISLEMIDQLRKEMRNKAGYINEMLNNVKSLDDSRHKRLTLEKTYFQGSWDESRTEENYADYFSKVERLVTYLKDECTQHVMEQINTTKDYDQTQCQGLLNIINKALSQEDVRSLHLTPLFELDLKLFLLGQAAPVYQRQHNLFFQENNMKIYLDKLKPQYFSMFMNVYHERDESKVRAQKFCEACLRPALLNYLYKNVGSEIVNDILTSGDSIRYSSRTFFQYNLLKELLEDHSFTQYIKYNNHYETFVKNWILRYITNKYKNPASLELLKSNILAGISRKVRRALKDPSVRESPNVHQCLKTFCTILKKYLVIAQNEMKVVVFQNNANPAKFTVDIEDFLEDVERQIITEINYFTIEYMLAKATLKPQDELFEKVFGCGKQCPFCKVPCEAGAPDHKEHFASVHRPQGLGTYRYTDSKVLSHSICSTDVVGNTTFLNSDTEWKPWLYREYRKVYPDWAIQPDATIGASIYWKYVFKEFNKQFSDYSNAKPADLPKDWNDITKKQALQSLMESFNAN